MKNIRISFSFHMRNKKFKNIIILTSLDLKNILFNCNAVICNDQFFFIQLN